MADSTLSLILNYIYFYHLDTYLILPMYPDLITDLMTATFLATPALARSAPVFTYSYSGPRMITITLDLHRDMFNKENSALKDSFKTSRGEDYVDLLVNTLLACAVPKYSAYTASYSTSSASALTVVPPMVALNFGETIFIKGVINSTVLVTYKKPILDNNKYACIQVTFTVYETEPYGAEQIQSFGSFRGITAGNTIRTT